MSRVSGMVERVRLMVLRGELPAGARVVEVHLAERFDLGRSTLREVLRHLAGNGLLVANESGGMRVVRLDGEELAHTLQVRAALEALSAGLAAERVGRGEVSADALRGAVTAGGRSPEEALHADRRFHRAVDVLSGNRACQDALDRLWDRLVVATLRAPAGHADADHRELVAAIAAGDAEEASAIARRHVLTTTPSAALG